MLIPKKKDVLRELALSLFLLLEFNPDTASFSLVVRIRERATAALKAAATYTGIFGREEVQGFLNAIPLNFTLPCKQDIVKGDIIRYTEDAYDGRRKPPRWLGKRTVTAEVTGIRPNNDDPMLVMKVMACIGAWELKPDVEIRRPLKTVSRSDAKRAAWGNEDERKKFKDQLPVSPKLIGAAATEAFTIKKRTD